jgi:hypothetical protein
MTGGIHDSHDYRAEAQKKNVEANEKILAALCDAPAAGDLPDSV